MNATQKTTTPKHQQIAFDTDGSEAKGRNGYYKIKQLRVQFSVEYRGAPPLVWIDAMSRAAKFPAACRMELSAEDAEKLRDALDTLLKNQG